MGSSDIHFLPLVFAEDGPNTSPDKFPKLRSIENSYFLRETPVNRHSISILSGRISGIYPDIFSDILPGTYSDTVLSLLVTYILTMVFWQILPGIENGAFSRLGEEASR